MKKTILSSLLLFSAVVVAGPVSTTNNTQSNTQLNNTDIKNSEIETPWQNWGLTKEDWLKYEELKKGERGIWSPDLDPLTTLGVEATTDAERKKYARLLAKKEAERVDKELSFQRAYDQAFKEMYGNIPLISNNFDANIPPTQITSANNSVLEQTITAPSKVLIFVKAKCDKNCDTIIKKAIKSSMHVDFYVVDSNSSDEIIKDWAVKYKIPISKIKQKQITLNHDKNNIWGKNTNQAMPAIIMMKGNKWEQVSDF